MLMLYLFKIEVLDLGLNYSYSRDCVVIADTHENRGRLIRYQFGDHNGSVVKRFVLLGARALSCAEITLLEKYAGTTASLWLATRIQTRSSVPHVLHLPRVESDEAMEELLEKAPDRFDGFPLMADQYIHSRHFFHNGSVPASLSAAA